MFAVGQKVVCVNDDSSRGKFCGPAYASGLRNGSIYTIDGIHGDELVSVVGIEGEWNELRFRPLVEKKTSIEVFNKLLLPVKELV